MGCTSSAPNTLSANASKEGRVPPPPLLSVIISCNVDEGGTLLKLDKKPRQVVDKSIQFEEDLEETYSKHVEAIDTERENRTEMKMLQPSDTTEPVQLVRHNKSTTSLEPEKDLNTNGHIVEIEPSDTGETIKELKDEKDEKISKLKLNIVGKFIEISQQDKIPDSYIEDPNSEEVAETAEKDNDETGTKADTESTGNGEEQETKSEGAEDVSPSQSQSSRATRWEALADIAAELPPSLTVDPITGQIYSLSK